MKQQNDFGKILLLATSVIILMFVSCSRSKEADDTIRIGFSVASDTFLLERWDKDMKIFMNVAGELGAEVVLAKSPGNAMGQIPQIQYLLEQDIDVLVVIPQDMELLSGVIKKTMDKGIPVLAYDRPIMEVPISGYVSFDNKEVGRLLAKALVTEVPQGNYLIVNGSVRDNNSYEVNAGVKDVIDPYVESGDISVVEEIWLELWSFDEAMEKIEEVLQSNPDIDAISCANDAIAGAAIQLLAERRLAGAVPVVGQDADLLACQRVVKGTQLMTVYKPISNLASRAAWLAVSFASGDFPQSEKMIDNRSNRFIPYYVETPIAVSAVNMEDTVIRDGFHTRDDIFLD